VIRRLAGFLIAPLPPALLVALWYSFFPGPLMAASMAVAAALYLYAVQIVFGIPSAIYLHRRNDGRLLAYVLAGAAIAGLPLLLFILWDAQSRSPDWEMVLRGPYWLTILGGIAGLTYWLVARPDRRLRANETE
jgi:Kef-type K+ transport system membrane component KefB